MSARSSLRAARIIMTHKSEIDRLRREYFRFAREYPRGRRRARLFEPGLVLSGGVLRCDLSDDLLGKLPPVQCETELRDFTDPLSVRIRPGRLASYQYLDRESPDGAIRRKVSIGLVSTLTADEARVVALRRAVEQIEHGRIAVSRLPQNITFVEAYQRYCRERWRGGPPFAKTLFDPLLKVFEGRKLREVARSTVIDAIFRLSLAKPNRAHDLHKRARAFFAWCVSCGGIDYNPLSRVRLPERTTRTRVSLDNETLGRIYRETATLGQPWRALVQFMMLTGASAHRARRLSRLSVQGSVAPSLGWGSGSPPLGSVLSTRAQAILSNDCRGWRYYFESERGRGRDQPVHLRPALLLKLQRESGVSGWTWQDLVSGVRASIVLSSVVAPKSQGGLLDTSATIEAWSETLEHFAFSVPADPLEGLDL